VVLPTTLRANALNTRQRCGHIAVLASSKHGDDCIKTASASASASPKQTTIITITITITTTLNSPSPWGITALHRGCS
jgi:hypothetical protein